MAISNNIVVKMNRIPSLAKMVIKIGQFLKYLDLSLMVIAIAGWKMIVTLLEKTNPISVVTILAPFILFPLAAMLLKKHYKGSGFRISAGRAYVEQKDGTEEPVTFLELKMGMKNKKINIGPDWIEIPYETGIIYVTPDWIESPYQKGKMRLYSLGKEDVEKLLYIYNNRCGVPCSLENAQERLRRYTVGWRMVYQFGWPCLLVGTYISLVRFMLKGDLSMFGLVRNLFSGQNFLGIGGLVIILIGYVIKLIGFFRLRKDFKPYKDYFHISW